MYGAQIAFRDFNPVLGFSASPFVGMAHFERFFNSFFFERLIRNTLRITIYMLVIGFPIPIILAIMLSELRSSKFRRVMQMLTYAPHFLSVVVVVGLVTLFFNLRFGIVNHAIMALGFEPYHFIASPRAFPHLFVWSLIWQSSGWNAIIFIAAVAGIDPTLYEAAVIDGASKIKRIFYVTIPCLMPTIVIMLIIQFGGLMTLGFERAFLMQNQMNIETGEIIPTYVFRAGIQQRQFSFASSVGLFQSVINMFMLLFANFFAKKIGETSLF